MGDGICLGIKCKMRGKKNDYISRKIGLCICAVQLIASAVFFVRAVAYEFIAGKICHNNRTGTSAFLCMRGIYTASFSKKKGIAGKVISILLSIGLIFGSYYIFKTTNVIENISGGDTKVTKMVVRSRNRIRLKNWKMQHRIVWCAVRIAAFGCGGSSCKYQ